MTSVLCLFSLMRSMAQNETPSLSAKMPVKEVTVFKDGNAFVLHQGSMPTDGMGNVIMDYLPAPVLGTFWPFVAQKEVKLSAVTAGQRRVAVERSALSIQELIEANPGASVEITETPCTNLQLAVSYPATILGLTGRSSKELEASAPPNSGDLLPLKGRVVLLKTATGTKAVQLDKIQDVTFKESLKSAGSDVEFRNLLTLQLDWGGHKPRESVEMGLMYLQKGIRWIPEYKVTLDGQGKAIVKMQATILNELTDMKDVTCHLVVGVPSFQFKDAVDPMALQQNLARLSQFFNEQSVGGSQMISNAMMTQAPRMEETAKSPNLGPEISGSEQVEDLHIFTVNHVTLRKGERMVVSVLEFTVPYHDIFVLDLPFTPPSDVWSHFNNQQQTELTRLLNTPKVIHKIRLDNQSNHPFTTAPTLIMNGNQVLGQGLMTYTSVGSSSDLNVGTAVDIQVRKNETETNRTPNACNWHKESYDLVELSGSVTLINHSKQIVDVEIVRHVLGDVNEVGQDGKNEKVNVLEDSSFMPVTEGHSASFWKWWSLPGWWSHFNGIGRITWKQKLEAGMSIELDYKWRYYWR